MNRRLLLISTSLLAVATESPGQDSARVPTDRWLAPGSASENRLRYLQTLGAVPRYPWSARAFSARELRLLASGLGAEANLPLRAPETSRRGAIAMDLAPVSTTAWYNSGFPFGMNDGAVWVGRGVTLAASAGGAVQLGPLDVTVAPVLFWAENRAFALAQSANALQRFADSSYPDVDRPQRFGESSYARVDLGSSAIRLDVGGVSAGLSNAHEAWGPMTEFPLILGTNAPGFLHAFIGASRPLNVGVGRVHGRVIYGSLEQSEYSPVTGGTGRRFGAGAVMVFEPRWLPGLELGTTRFFHVAWPATGLTSQHFTHLFESLLKRGVGTVFAPDTLDPRSSTDNQLASAFARWVMGTSGFEMYAEYGREDHNADARDLVLEPDHAAAYGLGVRKAWRAGDALMGARLEIVNFQSGTLVRHRPGDAWYRHVFTQQGHTNRGQLLATAIGIGSGAGATLMVERFRESGSARASWSRLVVRDPRDSSRGPSVQHVVQTQQTFQVRRNVASHIGIDGVLELNRTRSENRLNLRLEIGSEWFP